MTRPEEPRQNPRRGRPWELTGLALLVAGFGLELAGALAGHWLTLKVGIFLFVLGIPVYGAGLFLKRRR